MEIFKALTDLPITLEEFNTFLAISKAKEKTYGNSEKRSGHHQPG